MVARRAMRNTRRPVAGKFDLELDSD
jgi:hypothetical protein